MLPTIPLLLMALLASIPTARAEVWARLDPDGTPHFAREKLDERYQLFFKGRSSLDLDAARDGKDDRDVAAIRDSRLFARVAAHPNVRRYAALIERHATAYGVDPALVKAVITVESAFETGDISPKGAVGLMQVMPETGKRYGLTADATRTVEQKLRDPVTNVRIGTRYLADLLARFGDDLSLALAAYNAGERSVERFDNRVPPYPETQEYVKLVRAFHEAYRPARASPASPTPSGITIPRRGMQRSVED